MTAVSLSVKVAVGVNVEPGLEVVMLWLEMVGSMLSCVYVPTCVHVAEPSGFA